MGLRERTAYGHIHAIGWYLIRTLFFSIGRDVHRLSYLLEAALVILFLFHDSADLVSLTVQNTNGSITSQPFEVKDPPRDEPERPKPVPGTSAAQSRRAKNAAHRADDVGACYYSVPVCRHANSDVLYGIRVRIRDW